MSLRGKHVVLGVTGGIAAYKACALTSQLRKWGVSDELMQKLREKFGD